MRAATLLSCLVGFFGNPVPLELVLAENLRASAAVAGTRRALKKLEFSPSVATYVDDSNPDESFRGTDVLQVDSSPDRKEIALRFDLSSIRSRDDIKSVELVLECTNGSNRGGGIYKSGRQITDDITWNNRPYKNGQGLTKLASYGSVKDGRSYAIDVSKLINNGDGLESADVSMIILPEGKNGADYSTGSVKLIVETSELFTAPSPTPAVGGNDGNGNDESNSKAPFQLMMFWENGYRWQGTSERRRWCAVCGRGGKKQKCYDGYPVRITECDGDNKSQWWIRDGNKFRSYTNRNLCWDYTTKEFKLRRCGSSPLQDFDAKPSFTTRGTSRLNRFELVRATKSGCVTQKHHPKDIENILALPCDRARIHDTSYWVAQNPPDLSGH